MYLIVDENRTKSQGAVEVTREDVIRLQETVFLNDTLIDFYLRQEDGAVVRCRDPGRKNGDDENHMITVCLLVVDPAPTSISAFRDERP